MGNALRQVDFSVRSKDLRWLARKRKVEMKWCVENRRILRAVKESNPKISLPKKQKVMATILPIKRRR